MMTKINKKLRICILKKLSRQLSWICNPNKLGWRYVRIRRWPFLGSSCLKNGLVDMVGTYLHKCISSNGHTKRTNVEFRKITKFVLILFCLSYWGQYTGESKQYSKGPESIISNKKVEVNPWLRKQVDKWRGFFHWETSAQSSSRNRVKRGTRYQMVYWVNILRNFDSQHLARSLFQLSLKNVRKHSWNAQFQKFM